MHGKGAYLFPNHDVWKGTFRFDELHGVGILEQHSQEGIDNPPPRECIYHKNKRICFTDDLKIGVHILLLGDTFHSPGAVILGKNKKLGHFKVKMDTSGIQNLNLADVAFIIDHKAPRITLLEEYVPKAGKEGFTRDGTYDEQRYSYDQDLKNPTITDHSENWYSEKPPPSNTEEAVSYTH